MKNFSRLLSTTILCALTITPVFSQTNGTDRAISDGDIVVTAQKREQRLNDVGMAITAASGDTLVRRGITEVSGLTKLEPSLQFSQANTGTPVFTIRGVGYFDQSLAASPTVSVYQDEVAYPYSSLTKGVLLDVGQVEILKGPQGTLYGQNATGGAINFIAAKPTDSLAFGLDATLERFGRGTISGFLSGPITPTLKARLSASIDEGGAWQRSNTRKETLGDRNFKVGRLLLDWEPSDKLKVGLNLNGWMDDSERQANQLIGFRFLGPQYITPTPQYPGAPTDPAFYRPSQPYTQYPQHIQDILANPLSPKNARAADWIEGTTPRNRERFYQAALRIDYAFSDVAQLTSLTSYQHYTQRDRHDDAGVNVSNTGGVSSGKVESFSQELRLHGDFSGRKGNWLLGANYDSTQSYQEDVYDNYFGSASYLTGGSPFSVLPSPPFAPFQNYRASADVDSKTYSIFGNIEYNILDSLSVHAGIRHSWSRQKFTGCAEIDDPGFRAFVGGLQATLRPGEILPPVVAGQCTVFLEDNSLGPVNTRLNEENTPWRVGLDWKITPDNLFYVSVSRGFKAGASPTLGGQAYIQFLPVVQEELTSYEAGLKSSFLDRRLDVQLSIFHYDYTDKQVLGRIIDPTGVFGAVQALVNIPKSKEDGAELAVTFRPVTGLSLSGAATYLDSKVASSFRNYASYSTGPADQIDFKGEAFPFTPKWSLVYGARYDWNLNDRLTAFASVNGSYQSHTIAAFGADYAATQGPPLNIKGYGLVDASAGFGSADDRWRVELFGKNIFNKYYWTSAFYVNDTTVRVAGRPATYGVKLRYRY